MIAAVRAVGRFVWNTTVGLVRDFVASDLRSGVIRLHGFSPAMQAIVVVASVLLLGTILAYAGGDLLREGRELVVPAGGAPGRGTLVPRPLVPITIGLLAAGTALTLAGALHSRWWVRVVVLVLYYGIAFAFQGLAYSLREATGTSAPIGFVCMAGVALLFVLRWRAPPRPVLEFGALFLLVGVGFAAAQQSVVEADELAGTAVAVSELTVLLGLLVSLTQPLLFIAGLDVIAFGARASGWLLQYVDRRIAQWAVFAGLAALLAWRTRDVVIEMVDRLRDGPVGDTLSMYAGALGLLVLVWAYWWSLRLVGERAPGTAAGDDAIDHDSSRTRFPLGLAYGGAGMLFVLALLALQDLTFFDVTSGGVIDAFGSAVDVVGEDWFALAYRVVVGTFLAGVGVVLARRGRRTLGLFVGLIGVGDLYAELLTNVWFLERFFWDDIGPVDFWWVVLFGALTAWWLVSARLTELRTERLFYLVVLSALIRQSDFVANPFGPLLGFAGTGFVVFGLLWGFVTAGGWTNDDTPRLPRSSRVFLYLGYSLFSVALLNWFSATHDVAVLTDNADMGTNGQVILGYPLLYALFTASLAGAFANRPIDEQSQREEAP